MKPTYEELERERNELAAQVEWLRCVLTRMVNEKAVNGAFYHKVSDELFELAESALSEAPPSALAALKAQWQADIHRQYAEIAACDKPAQEAGDEN